MRGFFTIKLEEQRNCDGRGGGRAAPQLRVVEPKKTGACSAIALRAAKTTSYSMLIQSEVKPVYKRKLFVAITNEKTRCYL